MGLVIKVKYPDSLKGEGKIAEIENKKNDILLEVGKALQELIKEWMRQLQATRHNSFGAKPSNHFTPKGIHEPIVEKEKVSVPIFIPGINRAFHDIVINPVEAQSLAIPMNSDAYGMQPREYNKLHPKGTEKGLFRPKGKGYLAKNDAGKLVVMYLLVNSVHQNQDRTLLPTDDDMNKTILESVHHAIEKFLNNEE